jgi:hypothetical protein
VKFDAVVNRPCAPALLSRLRADAGHGNTAARRDAGHPAATMCIAERE